MQGVILSVAEPVGFPALSIELHKGKVRYHKTLCIKTCTNFRFFFFRLSCHVIWVMAIHSALKAMCQPNIHYATIIGIMFQRFMIQIKLPSVSMTCHRWIDSSSSKHRGKFIQKHHSTLEGYLIRHPAARFWIVKISRAAYEMLSSEMNWRIGRTWMNYRTCCSVNAWLCHSRKTNNENAICEMMHFMHHMYLKEEEEEEENAI